VTVGDETCDKTLLPRLASAAEALHPEQWRCSITHSVPLAGTARHAAIAHLHRIPSRPFRDIPPTFPPTFRLRWYSSVLRRCYKPIRRFPSDCEPLG